MYSYKGKIAGAIVAIAGFIAAIAEKLHPWQFSPKLAPDQMMSLFKWVMLLGLFTIGYSKERYDDDRAVAIRLKALQISVMLQQAVIMGMAFTSSLAHEPVDSDLLFVLAAIGIVMYLLLFHVGLYFDFLWDFNDKSRQSNPLKNWRKNKWSLLVYLLLGIIMLAIVTIFDL